MLIIDWQPDQVAGHDDVMALVKVLLGYGAERVAVWPSDVDFSQHTLDEIHGIDANNRDCALSRVFEPVVGSLDNQGLFLVC